MKKLLLLSALLIFACSSDDSSNQQQTPNNSIIIDGSETILNSAIFNADLASDDGDISFTSSTPEIITDTNGYCYYSSLNVDSTSDEFVYLILTYEGNNHGGNIGIPDGTYITSENWTDNDGTTRFDVEIWYQGEWLNEESDDGDDNDIIGIINITRNTPSTNINPYANYTISWEFIGPNGETITGYYNGDIYMCIN